MGFLGVAKDYITKKIIMPLKKPKGKELSEEQQSANKEISRERVVIEHSIGGMKRYRILADRVRMHDWNLFDTIVGICAGLWNYTITG